MQHPKAERKAHWMAENVELTRSGEKRKKVKKKEAKLDSSSSISGTRAGGSTSGEVNPEGFLCDEKGDKQTG